MGPNGTQVGPERGREIADVFGLRRGRTHYHRKQKELAGTEKKDVFKVEVGRGGGNIISL